MNASTTSTIPRRRWSTAEKIEILQAHAQRRESQTQFCRTRGVSVQTLHYWLRQRRPGRGGFVEIKPLGAAAKVSAASVAALVVIELADGLTIRVPAGCDVQWVVEFIGALRCGV